jgi:hypothetical protein
MCLHLKKKIHTMTFTLFSTKVDILLKKYPTYGRLVCLYFDWSSRITHFILFNPVIFVFIYFLIPLVISTHFLEINYFNKDLSEHGISYFFEAYKKHIGAQLTCLFLFLSTLIEVVITNTILCTTDTVTTYMKTKYGDDILKNRGYNVPSASVKRVITYAGVAIVSFGISATKDAMIAIEGIREHGITNRQAIRQAIEEDTRKYQAYLDHFKDKPDLAPLPPQTLYNGNITIDSDTAIKT